MSHHSRTQRQLPPNYPVSTASTEKEALRVLEWQKDVANSVVTRDDEYEYTRSRAPTTTSRVHGSRPVGRRYDSTPLPQSEPLRLVHRETITTRTYEENHPPERETLRKNSNGMSNTALIGTLIGAAAGAAVAYAMVQSKEPEELDPALAYPLPRPSLAPRAKTVYTTQTKSTYVAPLEGGEYVTSKEIDDGRVDVIPSRSYVSARPRDDHHSVPRILPAYPQATSIREGSTLVGEEDIDRDRDGRKSHASSGSSGRRSRSEAGSARYGRPLTILPPPSAARGSDMDGETYVSARSRNERRSSYSHSQAPSHRSHHTHHSEAKSQARSHAPSHAHSQAPSKARSHAPSRARSQSQSQANTHVSSSSRRSSSTIKPPTVIKVGARENDGANERRGSVISARNIPLPESLVSGGYAKSVAYAESLAPSDSVSSVGMKMERERMKGRMGY